MTYSFRGWTTGTCGCDGLLGCSCWRSSNPCSQFVAYKIESGQVDEVDVSGTTLVRLINESGNESILYLDANITFAQQQALVLAFTGRLGGRLANLAQIAPIQLPPKLAPIVASRQQQQAQITIGQALHRHSLKAVPFKCES